MCRHRSMPAALPADVRMSPSSTNSTFGSTCTAGKRRARSAHSVQCVVARRPSSSPALASANAPVHSDTIRLPRLCATRSTSASQAGIWSGVTVGSMVTMTAARMASGPAAATTWKPLSAVTGPGFSAHTVSRYQGTPRTGPQPGPNTSLTTPSSNAVTPSHTTAAMAGPWSAGPLLAGTWPARSRAAPDARPMMAGSLRITSILPLTGYAVEAQDRNMDINLVFPDDPAGDGARDRALARLLGPRSE